MKSMPGNNAAYAGKGHLYYLCMLVISLVMSGCAQNTAYRNDFTSCEFRQEGDCAQNAVQRHAPAQDNEYLLGFVEYDDQGQLRQREQMTAVLNGFYEIAAGILSANCPRWPS